MLHWLILLPYYLIGALAALPFLLVICRLLRFKVSINNLVAAAIGVTVALIVIPLACHCVALSAFSGRALLALLALSLLLAAVDRALAARLPLPLDAELRQL